MVTFTQHSVGPDSGVARLTPVLCDCRLPGRRAVDVDKLKGSVVRRTHVELVAARELASSAESVGAFGALQQAAQAPCQSAKPRILSTVSPTPSYTKHQSDPKCLIEG